MFDALVVKANVLLNVVVERGLVVGKLFRFVVMETLNINTMLKIVRVGFCIYICVYTNK